MPEHGFLGGKKFSFYPTLDSFNFHGQQLRVELRDERAILSLRRIPCAEVEVNNLSEFKDSLGTMAVQEYFQRNFKSSNIIIDPLAPDTMRIHLEALDSRLIGFGSITVHGLCKMRVDYPHSLISKNAFVSRKTANRIFTSAASRECLEKILIDMKLP